MKTGALGDGTSNLEGLRMWQKDILLGGVGELMKVCIVLGRPSESNEVGLMSECRVTDAAKVCP
jgi:hypothetical protein